MDHILVLQMFDEGTAPKGPKIGQTGHVDAEWLVVSPTVHIAMPAQCMPPFHARAVDSPPNPG